MDKQLINERVIECINGDISYHTERIKIRERALPFLLEIAEKLIEDFDPQEYKISFWGSQFSFKAKDNVDSFLITTKLLNLFPEIERFSKQFYGGEFLPTWKWVAGVSQGDTHVIFIVDKATPEEDCFPKQILTTYKTWVCES